MFAGIYILDKKTGQPIDAKDLTDRITEFKASIKTQNDRIIGNVPSQMVDMTIDNSDGYIKDIDNIIFAIDATDEDGRNSRYFLVQKAPEKYTKKISLTLFDLSILLNGPYKSKLSYEPGKYPTIKDQLLEIEAIVHEKMRTIFKISKDPNQHFFVFCIDTLPDHVLNHKAKWIDTTISMRNYIGWIAELAGTNAMIVSSGVYCNLYFKPVFDFEHKVDIASDYSVDKEISVSEVRYDDGVISFSSGDKTGKTLRIDSNNRYCDDKKFIDYLAGLFIGKSFYTLETLKTFGSEVKNYVAENQDHIQLYGYNIGDIVTYDNKKSIILNIERTFHGNHSSVDLSGSVAFGTNSFEVKKIDDKVRIKKIETLVNQAENKLSIVSQDVENTKKAQALLEVNVNKIQLAMQEKHTNAVKELKLYYALFDFGKTPQKDDPAWKTTKPKRPAMLEDLWYMQAYVLQDGTEVRLDPTKNLEKALDFYIAGQERDREETIKKTSELDKKIDSSLKLINENKSLINQTNNSISSIVESKTKILNNKQENIKNKSEELEKEVSKLQAELKITSNAISQRVEQDNFDGFKKQMESMLDINGLHVGESGKGKSNINSDGLIVTDANNGIIAKFTNDDSRVNFLNVREHLSVGSHRFEMFNDDLEITSFSNGEINTTSLDGTAIYWIGDVK